jgi:ubiquinone/menaquinone biosynthesis C-methylase UbiE
VTILPNKQFTSQYDAVNTAFSRQAAHYDADDEQNLILADMRKQVYDHVDRFIKPASRILELNAGTGIDAVNFVSKGHSVLATDLSDGMVEQIRNKIEKYNLHERLACEQLSYDKLDELPRQKFDYVFSNFGGLNCIKDLSPVAKNLPAILKTGAVVTLVIMPPIYLWEIAGFLKGHGGKAFRRLNAQGTKSHLEGEFFYTYYHSMKSIKAALGPQFRLIDLEGLAALSPPPHRSDFPIKHPSTYKALRWLDRSVNSHFPFNRWADHIITSFRYKG